MCQHAVAPRTVVVSAPDPIAGHCRSTPPLETPTHRLIWLNLLWGPCSFILGPGAHKVLFGSSKSLFPQSCVSSGSWVNGDLLQESLCHTQVCCTGAAAPAAVHCRPVPLQETLKHSSGSVSVGPWVPVCPRFV